MSIEDKLNEEKISVRSLQEIHDGKSLMVNG